MLDGGHLMFYAVEIVRGRPLSERAQEIGFRIGLALVLMLMLFATWNDILHIGAASTAAPDARENPCSGKEGRPLARAALFVGTVPRRSFQFS